MSASLELLNALIAGHTDRDEERQIIDLLRAVDADELNELLSGADADELLKSVDNRLIGPDHRDELIELLFVERRDDLSLAGRAALIYALQAGYTRSAHERRIADLLLDVRGAELSALKNLINLRTDVHDLEGLVFDAIDDEAVRAEILAHIAAEAKTFDVAEAKILSDIDDTVIARINDRRYPKMTLYPGILAFYQALDQGPRDQPFSTGDLTFITARPEDAFGLIETHTRSALRKAGIAQASVLSGSFFNLHTYDLMAAKKMHNIDHYRQLFPEYDLVFIGDSGQGDVTVGERMYEMHPEAVKAVFIHDVRDTPAAERAEHRRHGIYFVDTYVEAAAIARRLNLISEKGLARVITEARDGFERVVWHDAAQEQAMRRLIERDIAAAGTTT